MNNKSVTIWPMLLIMSALLFTSCSKTQYTYLEQKVGIDVAQTPLQSLGLTENEISELEQLNGFADSPAAYHEKSPASVKIESAEKPSRLKHRKRLTRAERFALKAGVKKYSAAKGRVYIDNDDDWRNPHNEKSEKMAFASFILGAASVLGTILLIFLSGTIFIYLPAFLLADLAFIMGAISLNNGARDNKAFAILGVVMGGLVIVYWLFLSWIIILLAGY